MLISLLSVSILLALTSSYAYYSQRLSNGDWETDYTAANVEFTVNDMQVSTITSANHGLLGRGDEAVLNFAVKVTSQALQNTDSSYHFSFDLLTPSEYSSLYPDEPSITTSGIDYSSSALARAIEVYEYINGEYVYLTSLDKFTDYDGIVPLSVTSNPIINNHTFKLVYSAAAGEYYENKGFILNMKAQNIILPNGSSGRRYVSTESELVSNLANVDGTSIIGRTLVLNRDITLTSNFGLFLFTVKGKFGIDLNGHRLTIASDVELVMDYSLLPYNAQDAHLGIYDSVPASVGGNRGILGKLTIVATNDIYYIQNDISCPSLSVSEYSFDRLFDALNKQANQQSSRLHTSGTASNPTYVDFYKNLSYYISSISFGHELIQTGSVNVNTQSNGRGDISVEISSISNSDFVILDSSTPVRPIINPAYNQPVTLVNGISITMFSNSSSFGGVRSQSFQMPISIRGNDASTIAQEVLALIPDSATGKIVSSLFLPNYDATTKATITWVTDDKDYLNEDGGYLHLGRDRQLDPNTVAEILDDWNDVFLKVGVIVDLHGQQFYAEKLVIIEIFDAEARTEQIYNYRQLVIEEEKSLLGLYDASFNHGDPLGIDYFDKAHFKGLALKIFGESNRNVTNDDDHLLLAVVMPDASAENGYKYILASVDMFGKIRLLFEDESVVTLNQTVETIIDSNSKQYTGVYDNISYTFIIDTVIGANNEPFKDTYLEIESLDPSVTASLDIYYNFKTPWDKSTIVDVELTFIYDNTFVNKYDITKPVHGETLKYVEARTIVAIGYRRIIELFDAKSYLQADFSQNLYIDGDSFEFYVKAYTPRGAYVYYMVEDESRPYATIDNGIFTVVSPPPDGPGAPLISEGKYYKDADGTYFFIVERFNYNSDVPGGLEYTDAGEYFIGPSRLPLNFYDEFNAGNIYTHRAKIKINPENLPAVEEFDLHFITRFYSELNEFNEPAIDEITGEPIWITQEDQDENLVVVEYILTLVTNGIYHNSDTEIADAYLYQKLVDAFDVNNNDYIEVKESLLPWSDIIANGNLNSYTYLGTQYYAAYLYSNTGYGTENSIANLKGLEYFQNVEGLMLGANAIVNLEPLSRLYNLKLLSLTNNRIADLTGLAFLDNLAVLDLSYNRLVDISPLEYLPNIQYLSLQNNPSIIDFLPISNYKKLKYYNAVISNSETMNGADALYALALTAANNVGNSIQIFSLSTSTQWTITNQLVVGAKALSEFLVINETYSTLNIPNTYVYLDPNGALRTYKIRWILKNSNDAKYLEFVENSNKETIGYVINSPSVNRDVSIGLSVVSDTGEAGSVYLSRRVNILLLASKDEARLGRLQFTQAEAESLEAALVAKGKPVPSSVVAGSYVYYLAKDIITDPKLLDMIFVETNSATTGTLSGSTFDNQYTLTVAERTTPTKTIIDFSNSGITSVEGMQYFPALYNGLTVNLSGNYLTDDNAIPDLTPLSKMTGMRSLTLSGLEYDFSQLLDNFQTPTLTTLTTLDVSGCYGLSDDKVLAGLYRLFLKFPSLSIYVASSSLVWNPYTATLALYKHVLQSTLTFWENNHTNSFYFNTDGNLYFSINFYGIQTIDFYVGTYSFPNLTYNTLYSPYNNTLYTYKNGTIPFSPITQSTTIPAREYDAQTQAVTVPQQQVSNVIGLRFDLLASQTDNLIATVTLYGNDGSNRGIVTATRYVTLKVELDEGIEVIDYNPFDTGARAASISAIFPGRSVRNAVLSRLKILFDTTSSSSSKINIGSGYYYDNVSRKHYLTMATLASLSFSTVITQAAPLYIDGIYYPSVSSNGYTYSNLYTITGLRYLSIEYIYFVTDARLGDGAELISIKSMVFLHSVVDFTTLDLRMTFPNLSIIKIGDTARTNTNYSSYQNRYIKNLDSLNNNYLTVKMFPELEILHILSGAVYDWPPLLSGLADSNIIKEFYIYCTNPSSSNNIYYANYNSNSPNTEAVVRIIYSLSSASDKDFRIGAPGDIAQSYDTTYKYTPLSWSSNVPHAHTYLDIDADMEFLEFYNYLLGVDLRFKNYTGQTITALHESSSFAFSTENGVLYRDVPDRELTTQNDTLYLPASTFNYQFGTDYGVDSTVFPAEGEPTTIGGTFNRAFSITWIFHGLTAESAIALFPDTQSKNYTFTTITNDWGGSSARLENADLTDLLLTYSSTALITDSFFILEAIVGSRTGRTSTTGFYDAGAAIVNGKYVPVASDFKTTQFSAHKSFIYPILARKTIGAVTSNADRVSYATIVDLALRTTIFISMVRSGFHSADISASGAIGGSVERSYTPNLEGLKIIGAHTNFANNLIYSASNTGVYISHKVSPKTTYESSLTVNTSLTGSMGSLRLYTVNVYKLDGLSTLFPNLKELSITYQHVISLTGLENLASTLTHLDLEANLINDVSLLRNFTSLRSVSFSGNVLKTVVDATAGGTIGVIGTTGQKSVFHASAATLFYINLGNNTSLALNNVAALANSKFTNKTSGFNPYNRSTFFELNLFNTLCVKEALTYKAIKKIFDDRYALGFSTIDVALTYYFASSSAGNNNSTLEYNSFNIFYTDVIDESTRAAKLKDILVNYGVDLTGTNGKTANETLTNIGIANTTYRLNFLSSSYLTSEVQTDGFRTDIVISAPNLAYSYQLYVRYDISFNLQGTKSYALRTNSAYTYETNAARLLLPSEFDPAMWSYLVYIFKLNGTTDATGGYITYTSNFMISITFDIGLRSLKGIEQLYDKLTGILIYNNPLIEEGWAITSNKMLILTHLNIHGAFKLTENQWAAIIFTLNPNYISTGLFLAEYPLNYTMTLDTVYTSNSISCTTLALLIATMINVRTAANSSTRVSFGNFYQPAIYFPSANNMLDVASSYFYHGATRFMGEGIKVNSASTDGKLTNATSYYLHFDITLTSGTIYNNDISSETSRYQTERSLFYYTDPETLSDLNILAYTIIGSFYANAYTSETPLYTFGSTYQSTSRFTTMNSANIANGSTYVNVWMQNPSIVNRIRYFANATRSVRPETYIYPSKIYQYDVETTNATFYLPISITYKGQVFTVSSSVASTYSQFLTTGPSGERVFSVTKDNFPSTQVTFSLNISSIIYYYPVSAVSTGINHSITLVPTNYIYSTLTQKRSNLYFQLNEPTIGDLSYALVSADVLFDSPLLILTMLDGALTSSSGLGSIQPTPVDFNGVAGYYYSKAQIDLVSAFSISFSSSTSPLISNNPPSSLKGLEIFTNLKEITIVNSIITDLTPLSNLKLQYLRLSFNAAYTPQSSFIPKILPISLLPLLNSKDTLKTLIFYEEYYAQEVILGFQDAHILKAFTALNSLQLGSYTNTDTNIRNTYKATSSFALLSAWYFEHKPGYLNAPTVFTPQYTNAVLLFEQPNYLAEWELFDISLDTGVLITPRTNALKSVVDGTWDITIPSYIEHGGLYDPLLWYSTSSAIKMMDYKFTGRTSTEYSFLNGAYILHDGDSLNFNQFKELLGDFDFISKLYSREITCGAVIRISNTYDVNSLVYSLMARVNIENVDFDMPFVVDLRGSI